MVIILTSPCNGYTELRVGCH